MTQNALIKGLFGKLKTFLPQMTWLPAEAAAAICIWAFRCLAPASAISEQLLVASLMRLEMRGGGWLERNKRCVYWDSIFWWWQETVFVQAASLQIILVSKQQTNLSFSGTRTRRPVVFTDSVFAEDWQRPWGRFLLWAPQEADFR